MSEKYAFWVTLRILGTMRQGEAELCKQGHYTKPCYIYKAHFSTAPKCEMMGQDRRDRRLVRRKGLNSYVDFQHVFLW